MSLALLLDDSPRRAAGVTRVEEARELDVPPGAEAPSIIADLEAAGWPRTTIVARVFDGDTPTAFIVRRLDGHQEPFTPREDSISDSANALSLDLASHTIANIGPRAITPWFRPDWVSDVRAVVTSRFGPILELEQYRIRPWSNTLRILTHGGSVVEVTQGIGCQAPSVGLPSDLSGSSSLGQDLVALELDDRRRPVGLREWEAVLRRAFVTWSASRSSTPEVEEVVASALARARRVCLHDDGEDDLWFDFVESKVLRAVERLGDRACGLVNVNLSPYNTYRDGATSDWSGLDVGPAGAWLTSLMCLSPRRPVEVRETVWAAAVEAFGATGGSHPDAQLRSGLSVGCVLAAGRMSSIPERTRSERRAWALEWLNRALKVTDT